jgi:predicted HTH domain antitoxin
MSENHELWDSVVSSYLYGDISLAKAAELLGMHALELRERFMQLGIPIRLGPETIEEAKAEADAIRRMLPPEKT